MECMLQILATNVDVPGFWDRLKRVNHNDSRFRSMVEVFNGAKRGVKTKG